jgi:hypothetical protein
MSPSLYKSTTSPMLQHLYPAAAASNACLHAILTVHLPCSQTNILTGSCLVTGKALHCSPPAGGRAGGRALLLIQPLPATRISRHGGHARGGVVAGC